MDKNLRLFFLLVILLVGLAALGIKIENRLVGRNSEFCASPERMRMPVIEEFRSDSVVLSGSQYELKKGKPYQFGDGEFDVRVKLLDITDESATFFIDVREPYYAPPADPPNILGPHKVRRRCKIVVRYDDETYLSQFSDVQIRPVDLEERLDIDQYTEYVNVGFHYEPTAISRTLILISATHNSLPYSILQVWYKYDSEDSAAAAFDENFKHLDFYPGEESTNYRSQANTSHESCDLNPWMPRVYMAQHHEYLTLVFMNIQEQVEQFPVEDWQFLLSQVEARFTQ